MLHRSLFSLALLLVIVVAGCDRDSTMAPTDTMTTGTTLDTHGVTPEDVARQFAALAGWEMDAEALATLPPADALARTGNIVSNFQRQDLGNGIAHYFAEVRFGPGPYDLIGLHRVVKERFPGFPGRKLEHLFLLHGDAKDFAGMWLPGVVGPNTPDDVGLAIYLAENDIDVWGIDQGWCFIPADETDQSVGQGWGLQRSADDLRFGVAAARIGRLITGSGGAPMNVLGYSSGVMTIFAAASDEAVLPRWQRQIGGLVPADFYYKTNVPEAQALFCDYAAFDRAALDNGDILLRVTFDIVGAAYATDPEGDSQVIEGFSNAQVFWFFTAGQIFDPETFHYFASVTGPDGFFAESFVHVPEEWVVDFVSAGIPYQPNQFIWDYDRTVCDSDDVPWDDNLHLIEVPIFNLAARGGANDYGLYAAGLTASDDVTSTVVTTNAPDDIRLDFGHIDLFLAPISEELAWAPLLQWVEEHAPRPGRGRRAYVDSSR